MKEQAGLFPTGEGLGQPGEVKVKVFQVSELTRLIRGVLEGSFPYVWVEGEIGELKVSARGHTYFTLKDEAAQLDCVVWAGMRSALRFELKAGMKLLVGGEVTVFEPRGRYQLIVSRAQPSGAGELALAFEQLKEKLAAEGLFDPARKRPLPGFVRRVALVTSPQGAAVRDLIVVMTRRFPRIQIVVFPTAVQGEDAPPQIVEAIKDANRMGGFDVLIVGRGGGSQEDLWAFNDERVVRAIVGSRLVTVSAVGHEVDFTLADFAADHRAPTPSAAAELVVPVEADFRRSLADFADRLERAIGRFLERAQERVTRLRQHPALLDPLYRVRQAQQQLDEAIEGLSRGAERLVSLHRARLETLTGKLDSLSPLAVLSRGYSIAFALPERRIVTDALSVPEGTTLEIRLHRGRLDAEVRKLYPGADDGGKI